MISDIGTNILITTSQFIGVFIHRLTPRIQKIIRLEALVNGHASKVAQRMIKLPTSSLTTPNVYQLMEKLKTFSKVRFLSSRFTLMIKTKQQLALIWTLRIQHLPTIPPRKKFYFCHYSPSKSLMYTSLKKNIRLWNKIKLHSIPRLSK